MTRVEWKRLEDELQALLDVARVRELSAVELKRLRALSRRYERTRPPGMRRTKWRQALAMRKRIKDAEDEP